MRWLVLENIQYSQRLDVVLMGLYRSRNAILRPESLCLLGFVLLDIDVDVDDKKFGWCLVCPSRCFRAQPWQA